MDYKKTLNLPQTDFPMKADLVHREPETLKKWRAARLYHEVLKKNAGRPKFVLHDGPPYANGNIHFGHILNKILKDIIVKYKNMSGLMSPFIPGWDCHGLPIEHQVDKDLGPKKQSMSKLEIRNACREYAARFVEIQKQEFERLGILGEWESPYLTMSPDYEATIAREFGRFVKAGNIYKGKKPVLWCPHCQTALAEAEIEYQEHESPSLYVRFPLVEDLGDLLPKLKGKKVSVIIWTTTPWTLPANLAVALHPNYDYVALPFQNELVVIAKNLLDPFCKLFQIENPELVDRFSGRKLEKRLCAHPFLPRNSPIILAEHVTIDTGTGCVHTAPGHGEEDFVVGLQYGLETLTPVDPQGRFTQECGVPEWVGLNVFEANPKVAIKLKEQGNLLKEETIRHNYPHCWRCKNPVIFRATEQWFLSLKQNDLRGKAMDAIRRVEWIPKWGRERIHGMIEKRPDWCLSRQRSWGVPIIAFRCQRCNYFLLDGKIIESIAGRFETEGSDIWFSEPPEKLLPEGTSCPHCKEIEKNQMGGIGVESGGALSRSKGISPRLKRASGSAGASEWTKEQDILDVWFDSGVSFAAVAEKRLAFPADLYLEGSDQHRGWFHSSLLTAVGTRGKAPYRTVLTHGFVVDAEGKKYSKSARNYLPPDKVLDEHGAEILRLWVAAEDYRSDIRVSHEILTRLVEAYRKIRNTCRFLLGNLYDFNPATPVEKFEEIDLWALHCLQKLVLRITKAYEEYNFHIIFHELNRFCTVDLSSFYLDILKDRLYVSSAKNPMRRAAQRVLFETSTVLARLMAPILSFTAEEVWSHLPPVPQQPASVHLASFPDPDSQWINEALASRWEKLREIRSEILKALEKARAEKQIGSSLEAKVVLIADGEPKNILESFGPSLRNLLIVSQVEWGSDIPDTAMRSELFPTLFIEIQKAEGKKCSRCWNWGATVGLSSDDPELCQRCHQVLHEKPV